MCFLYRKSSLFFCFQIFVIPPHGVFKHVFYPRFIILSVTDDMLGRGALKHFFYPVFLFAATGSQGLKRADHIIQGSLSGLEPIRFSEATAPAILRQKSLQYLHIAAHFSLVYPKHLLTENCAHPSPKEFLTDFGDARRRKVRTFQGERRKKTRKFIGEGLVGSNPLRLAPLCHIFPRPLIFM